MTMTTFIVYDVNSDTKYIFGARTPYEAMTKMLYCENIKALDRQANIEKTRYGLYLKHRRIEYWTREI